MWPLVLGISLLSSSSEGSVVRVAGEPGNWYLEVNGAPTFIQGVGGTEDPHLLETIGVNSMRTWGAENAEVDLDKAAEHGMHLLLGYWLPHAQHGFDYSDPQAVAELEAEVLRVVRAHKDHPGLLAWALGNEMELGYEGDWTPIWQTIDRIALSIKEIDPNHPVTTVVAGPVPEKLEGLREHAPSLDFISVNGYGNLYQLPRLLQEMEWDVPYMITEFGARGQWESPLTPWGSPMEETSTEKARRKAYIYDQVVRSQAGNCLGSYAFLWTPEQERRIGWFNLRLSTGEWNGLADTMERIWTGEEPANRSPEMLYTESNAHGAYLEPGEEFWVRTAAVDPDGDPVSYSWQLTWETEYLTEDDQALTEAPLPTAGFSDLKGDDLYLVAPTKPGPYKLYAIASDGKGKVATGSIQFYVREGGSED
jgi:hypothetical protein